MSRCKSVSRTQTANTGHLLLDNIHLGGDAGRQRIRINSGCSLPGQQGGLREDTMVRNVAVGPAVASGGV